jgi:hypothetical protein
MQYMLLIYEDEGVYADPAGTATMEIVGKHMALAQSLGTALVSGSGLKNTPTATTVRTGSDGKQVLHDGPFAETKEQLGGYYLVDVPDLDAALAIARKIPLRAAGAIEVRPLLNGERKG